MNDLYIAEKKELIVQQLRHSKVLHTIYPTGIIQPEGDEPPITIDDYIMEQTAGMLERLSLRYFPPASAHMWIGVNPPIDKTKHSMQKLWALALELPKKYKWMNHSLFCIESHTNGGYRPHLHIFTLGHEKLNRITKALSNHFQVATQSINHAAHKNGHLYEEHKKYILGDKATCKMDDVEADQKERLELGIPDFHSTLMS